MYFPAGLTFKVSSQLDAAGLTDSAISGYGATLALTAVVSSTKDDAKAVLQLRNCTRVRVVGLTVRDTDRTYQYNGVRILSSQGIVVDGVAVHNVRFNGIAIFDAVPGTSTNITITNCTAQGTRFGISSNGDDVRITGNHVAMYWPSTSEGQSGLPWNGTTSDYFDGICVWTGGDRTVISGNTITECGQAGVYCNRVTNLVVTDNTVVGCVGRGIEVDGTDGRAYGVTITGNVLYNNHGNINLIYTSYATVVGNRIENPDAAQAVTCVAVNTGTDRTTVVGNHARQAHATQPALWVHDQSTDVTLAWNEIDAAVPYTAPAAAVVMERSGAGLITAAGSLKATGKIIAVGGLGVGNSATASTPGTVVRKMEVFSSTGASLGWVPIYNAIS